MIQPERAYGCGTGGRSGAIAWRIGRADSNEYASPQLKNLWPPKRPAVPSWQRPPADERENGTDKAHQIRQAGWPGGDDSILYGCPD